MENEDGARRLAKLEKLNESMQGALLAQHYLLSVLLQYLPSDYAQRCMNRDLPNEIVDLLLSTDATDRTIEIAKELTQKNFKVLLNRSSRRSQSDSQ